LRRFLPKYPEVKIDIGIDYGVADIVAQFRHWRTTRRDDDCERMISVRIAPDMRLAVVAAANFIGRVADRDRSTLESGIFVLFHRRMDDPANPPLVHKRVCYSILQQLG
jgi:hypothetical protein